MLVHLFLLGLGCQIGSQNLLEEYVQWLQSNNAREGKLYKESFEQRWPSIYPKREMQFETFESLKKVDELSLGVIRNFSGLAASKSFEQEIREVVRFFLLLLKLQYLIKCEAKVNLSLYKSNRTRTFLFL